VSVVYADNEKIPHICAIVAGLQSELERRKKHDKEAA